MVAVVGNATEERFYGDGVMEWPIETPFDYAYIRVFFIFMYGIVFAATVLGNLLVIFVILRHRRMRTVINCFLANLALSDLLVGVFCVLPNLSSYLSPYWYLGRVMCKLYYFVQNVCFTASTIVMTVISLERYVVIVYPMKNKRLARVWIRNVTSMAIWIVAIAYGAPLIVAYDIVMAEGVGQWDVESGNGTDAQLHGHPESRLRPYCLRVGGASIKTYVTTNFVLWFCSPLLLMALVYSRIARVLGHSAKVCDDVPLIVRRPPTYRVPPTVAAVRNGHVAPLNSSSTSTIIRSRSMPSVYSGTAGHQVNCASTTARALLVAASGLCSPLDQPHDGIAEFARIGYAQQNPHDLPVSRRCRRCTIISQRKSSAGLVPSHRQQHHQQKLSVNFKLSALATSPPEIVLTNVDSSFLMSSDSDESGAEDQHPHLQKQGHVEKHVSASATGRQRRAASQQFSLLSGHCCISPLCRSESEPTIALAATCQCDQQPKQQDPQQQHHQNSRNSYATMLQSAVLSNGHRPSISSSSFGSTNADSTVYLHHHNNNLHYIQHQHQHYHRGRRMLSSTFSDVEDTDGEALTSISSTHHSVDDRASCYHHLLSDTMTMDDGQRVRYMHMHRNNVLEPRVMLLVGRGGGGGTDSSSASSRKSKGQGYTLPQCRSTLSNISVMQARRKVLKLLLAVLASFAFCSLPYQLYAMWQTWKRPAVTEGDMSISFSDMLLPPLIYLVLYFNSCLNPILYALLSENFRKYLRQLIRKNIFNRASRIVLSNDINRTKTS